MVRQGGPPSWQGAAARPAAPKSSATDVPPAGLGLQPCRPLYSLPRLCAVTCLRRSLRCTGPVPDTPNLHPARYPPPPTIHALPSGSRSWAACHPWGGWQMPQPGDVAGGRRLSCQPVQLCGRARGGGCSTDRAQFISCLFNGNRWEEPIRETHKSLLTCSGGREGQGTLWCRCRCRCPATRSPGEWPSSWTPPVPSKPLQLP